MEVEVVVVAVEVVRFVALAVLYAYFGETSFDESNAMVNLTLRKCKNRTATLV